jgi:hypothetical protein
MHLYKNKIPPRRREGIFFGSIERLQGFDVSSLQSLGSLFDFELDRLAFLEGAEPIGLYGAVMDENIRAAFACEETISLRRIEPFDRTGHTLCHFIPSPYMNKRIG